jgi:spore germination protein YaaH
LVKKLTVTIFIGLDYAKLGQEVDGITLISYVFGYSEVIPPEKTYIGVPVIGYVWMYSYIPGIS